MCGPIAAATLTAISTGIGMATSAASMRTQAQVHDRQQQLERIQGNYAATRATERGRQLIGRQVAGIAANGIAVNTGSAASVVGQTGEDIALDVAAIRYGSAIASENEALRGRIQRANANATMASIPLAMVSSGVSTYASLAPRATQLRGAYV